MGQYGLIFVASVIVAGAFTMFGLRSDTSEADKDLNHYHVKRLAHEASVTGYNITVAKLLAGAATEWTDGAKYSADETSFDGGWFTATVTPVGTSGDTVDIVSTGFRKYITSTGTGSDTTHVIDARWVRMGVPPTIPPAFGYAVIASDMQLKLAGGFEIRSLDPNANANVHSNGTLVASSNQYYVEGMGTYTTSEDVVNDNFYPNDDWNGTDRNVFWTDSVHLPALDMTRMRAEANLHITADMLDGQGAYVIDGDTWPHTSWEDLGTALDQTGAGTEANPFILVVEGDLDIMNYVQMDGWGMFAVTGDLTVKGSAAGSKTELNGFFGELSNYRTQSGIFAQGSVILNAGVTVKGTIFGESGLTGNGGVTVYGGLASPVSNFKGAGGAAVWYGGPNAAIVEKYFIDKPVVGPRLIAYSEW